MADTAVRSRPLLDGRYELLELIGQGTFGRVYRGFDRRLGRSVAVKVIKPWWTEDPQWTERFEAEAHLMARLGDPGIVQIYDIGHSGESAYYVAELVDGESLDQRLTRGALPPAEALDVAEQLGRALGHAHARRVVHRDVKPGNVLIDHEGRVKVGDFGVARLAEGTNDGPTGTVLGTPRYMAPEQARGRPPTPGSDVYSAGVVLYEMLAGRPPFVERSGVELALRHIADPPPPLPAHTPRALVEIVGRALAKDPGARYATGNEFAEALARARSSVRAHDPGPDPAAAATPSAPRVVAATRVGPRRHPRRNVNPAEVRRYRALLGVVVLIVLGGLLGAALTSGARVRVPALHGLDRGAAALRLRRADLRPRFSRRYAALPAGTVLSQVPAPGARVASEGTVQVVVSAGPRPVVMPPLLGQQTVAAKAILSRLGLDASVTQVPAPGVTPGLVVQQSPSVTAEVAPGSRVSLSVAETPRWRPLVSFSGAGNGSSGKFQIRGDRWRIVYAMGYDGTCTLIFFCSGPSVRVTNATTGATVNQFDLNEGSGQDQVFSTGPGAYQIAVSPGSDSAHWSFQIEDDY